MSFNEWGADRWRRFQPARATGAVMFINPSHSWTVDYPCYVEVHDEQPFDGSPPCRIPLFCDIRQLGLTDSVRRAVLRRPRAEMRKKVGDAPGRMLITDRDYQDARANGLAPTVPFTVVAVQPHIYAPGLPCVVMAGPDGSPLEGHNVLVVDKSYRHKPAPLDPEVQAVKQRVARALLKG